MRRKKRVIFLAFILMALLLAGCHNSVEQGSESQIIESEEIQSVEGQSTVEESTVEEKSEEENIYKDIISAYSDISTDIWYVIDDLNWNGRPEVIIAMRQGTALYTDFTVFELNESKDGIDQYSFSKENTYMKDIEDGESISDSLPDVIVDNVKWTRNSDTIQYEYIFTDTLRVLQGEHYVGYYRVWFDDSVVYQKLIAYMYTKQENETFTKEMYYDECGKEITKKEFEELISVAVEGKKLNWIKYEEEKFKDKLSEHGLLLESVSNNQIEVLTAEEFKYYIERYLDMTIQEISEETNVYLDEEDGTLRILSNAAFFPVLALQDKGIFVICPTYDTAYKPRYVTVHYDIQHILLEEFGITNDMDFEGIKEAMTMAGWQLDEHIEWGGDYADVYSNGELLYTFCSYREDGSHFQIYISDCPDEEEEAVKPMIENGRIGPMSRFSTN